MSVRFRTYVAMGLLLLGILFSVLLYTISSKRHLNELDDLDRKAAAEDILQIVSVFKSAFSDMEILVLDWSLWDDTYDFVADLNEEYVESNLVESTFSTSKIQVILFFDTSGEMAWGRAYDPEEEEYVEDPHALIEKCKDKEIGILAYREEPTTIVGLLTLEPFPLFISSSPILTSDEEGPSRGTLVMGRYLTPAIITEIAGIARTNFNILPLSVSGETGSFAGAITALGEGGPVHVAVGDRNTLDGYTYLEDITGEPTFLLMARKPREIYSTGSGLLTSVVFITLLIVLGLGAAVIWSLEKNLLGRLAYLDKSVRQIEESGSLSERLTSSGNDELSYLTLGINQLLETNERTQLGLNESKAQLQGMLDQKETLLKEVHHRVKNNLQAISSLLDAQSAVSKEETDGKVLKEAQSYIQSVALIHQQLYVGSTEGRVDFGKYANALVNSLKQAYRETARNVQVETVADEVLLNTDTAIPMGLVLNEVVSNSFKHGFVDGRKGRIAITIRNEDLGGYSVTVTDDGVGIPEDDTPGKKDTLGQFLIVSLVNQIGGHVETVSNKGLKTKIVFEEYRECDTLVV